MSVVRLLTASSISQLDFSLIFRLIVSFIISWNFLRSVRWENSSGGMVRTSGVTGIVSKTDEWSEFKSRVLSVEQYKLVGILAAKMSKISGFLLSEVGQYVGSAGARILICFSFTRLYNTIPRRLLARQPQL